MMSWKFSKEKEKWALMKPHLERLFKFNLKDFPHALVNIFVEFCRLMPYQAGHIWFSLQIIQLLLIIYLLV